MLPVRSLFQMEEGPRECNLLDNNRVMTNIDIKNREYLAVKQIELKDNQHGKGIMPQWEKMISNYYNLMGWDEKTGVTIY